ncbi:MAG: tetratricopeptide repeat protein [bacterium]
MKKIYFSLLFMLIFATNAWAGDYYFVGADAFKKGVYDKAAANLEHAIRISPKNVNARYYLAQTYLMQKRVNDAQQQYNRIIIIAPTSDAAILSQKGLSLIRQSELGIVASTSRNGLEVYQDNYLDYVISDGDIFKWASFPLNVYIEPKKQKVLAQKAFEQWQAKSNRLVNFNFVTSPANAQIVVDFKDSLETSSGGESYIAGFSKPYYQGDNIIKSEIHILVIDPDTKKELEDDFITFSTLHEIGHTLGLKGHSPNENDVMSAIATEAKPALTQRDLNTLNIFYKINKQSLLTRGQGQTDVQLNQALDYAKKIPNKSVGWTNLGDIYRNKKMYPDAIKNYQKAISIEPKKAELYNLLGATYLNMGDKKNSFTNLKRACDLEKSNVFYLYQFAQLCFDSNQKEVGKGYIKAYLQSNPQGKSDEKIQSLLKLYR